MGEPAGTPGARLLETPAQTPTPCSPVCSGGPSPQGGSLRVGPSAPPLVEETQGCQLCAGPVLDQHLDPGQSPNPTLPGTESEPGTESKAGYPLPFGVCSMDPPEPSQPPLPTHPPLSGASQRCQAMSRDRAPVLVAALLREAWRFCQLPRAGPTGLCELQGHLTLSGPGNAQTTDPVPAQGSCGRTNGSAEGTLKREGFSPCSTAGVSVYLVPPTCHSGGMGAPQDPSLHGEVAASRRMPGPLLPGDSGGALGGVAGLWPRCGPPVVGFHRGCGSPTRGGSGDGAAARGLRPRMCCLGFPH